MRRLALLLAAALSLLLLGASPTEQIVLPPSAQTTFEHVMHAVNKRNALGTDVRITDIAIKHQKVVIQFKIKGQALELRLVHPGKGRRRIVSRYFAFDYDQKAWQGHDAELEQLASLLDRSFPRTPWFIATTKFHEVRLLGVAWVGLELSRRLSMTLFGASWALGLIGIALLLRRRRRSLD